LEDRCLPSAPGVVNPATGAVVPPPSQLQASFSLAIDAAYTTSYSLLLTFTPGGFFGLDNLGLDPTETAKATANAAAAGINFNALMALNNYLGSLLLSEGLGPGNVVADAQFNLPYAGPFAPFALSAGVEAAYQAVQQ
jgi:hypothetical protein